MSITKEQALRVEVKQIEDGRWVFVHPMPGNSLRIVYCATGDEGQAEADELAEFWNLGAEYAALASGQSEQAAVEAPEGWQWVPVVPTETMRATFRAEPHAQTFVTHTTLQCADFDSRYRAMLSASPVPAPAAPADPTEAQAVAYCLAAHARTLRLAGRNDALVEDMVKAAKLLAAPAGGAGVLTDEQIDAIWEGLDGKALITGENQLNWNRALRRAFAKAVLSATPAAPDGQPAAWMTEEDEPRTCAAHQKASMPKQTAASYTVPLYAAPPGAVPDAQKEEGENAGGVREDGK